MYWNSSGSKPASGRMFESVMVGLVKVR